MKIPKSRLIFTFIILVSPTCTLGTDEFNHNIFNRHVGSDSLRNTETEAGTSSVVTPNTTADVEEDLEIVDLGRRIREIENKINYYTEKYKHMPPNKGHMYHIKTMMEYSETLKKELMKINSKKRNREMTEVEIEESYQREKMKKYRQDMTAGLETQLQEVEEKLRKMSDVPEGSRNKYWKKKETSLNENIKGLKGRLEQYKDED